MTTGNYIRVTRQQRCPICGKPDWCMVSRDGTAAICPRVPEGGKYLGDAGYLHKLGNAEPPAFKTGKATYTPPRADFNADEVAKAMQAAVNKNDVGLQAYADALGLSVSSQHSLGIGYSYINAAFSYPMKDHAGNVIGIRLRNWEGRKWAINGSRSGLFLGPKRNDDLYIGEGPTDTSALIDLGCWAIGRPSCRGGTVEIVKYVQRHRPPHIVIVSDCDGPGVLGAETLADALWPFADAVRIIEPLVGKDIRQWRIQGCTSRQLAQVAMNSAPWVRNAQEAA